MEENEKRERVKRTIPSTLAFTHSLPMADIEFRMFAISGGCGVSLGPNTRSPGPRLLWLGESRNPAQPRRHRTIASPISSKSRDLCAKTPRAALRSITKGEVCMKHTFAFEQYSNNHNVGRTKSDMAPQRLPASPSNPIQSSKHSMRSRLKQ